MSGHGSGKITKRYTIWCGNCYNWEDLEAPTESKAADEAKERGWTQGGMGAWHCPRCTTVLKERKERYAALPIEKRHI